MVSVATKDNIQEVEIEKMDVTKKVRGGGSLKKYLRYFSMLLISDLEKLGYIHTFLMNNKDILGKCMYAQNKVMLPLDLDSDGMAIRFEDISKGVFGKASIYRRNRDYSSYTKTDVYMDRDSGKWVKKVDNTNVTKLMNYSRIKEKLIEDFQVKVRKNSDVDIFKKKLRYAYVTQLDRRVSDIARDFGLSKEKYLDKVGNVTKIRENEYELYRAYQKRVTIDYNNGFSLKEIYSEYNTSKDPVLRAVKENCDLITDKEKFEETILRCYAEGMTINEVNRYFKPIKRGFYTKEEFIKLIHDKGHSMRDEGGYITPSGKIAMQLFRNGCPLENLVNEVQRKMGREESKDIYWRQYTRYLIGVTEGKNGVVDFDTQHKTALRSLNGEENLYGI